MKCTCSYNNEEEQKEYLTATINEIQYIIITSCVIL